jgi:signal peptidase II
VREVRFQSLIRGSRTAAALISVVVVVADQLTKTWALNGLADGPINLIGEVVRFELTRNSGAAFGLLEGAGSWLALLAVVVVVVVFLSLRHDMSAATLLALGLVLGGALGNLIDRLFRGDGLADGLVVDFIDVGWWPNFNVADSAIVIGIILILWESLTEPSRRSSPTS